MIGISIRASWDFQIAIKKLRGYNFDFFEIQLDNPIFKFPEWQANAIKILDELKKENVHLAFHLSFIDTNIASLDEDIRYNTNKVLEDEISFSKQWDPLYFLAHTGKISETFFQNAVIKEKANEQQRKTIGELLKFQSSSLIPLAIENRQKSNTVGLIEKNDDMQYYHNIFPNIHFVLDLGHLNTHFNNPDTLLGEVKQMSDLPIIAVHLSNNYGQDTHETLENGTILITQLFSEIKSFQKKLLIIENKTLKDALKSIEFLHTCCNF